MLTLAGINPLTVPDPAAPALERLRTAADGIVGSTFYGTLLRIQRESGLKGPYGHGGRGEEAFRAQLDQVLAEQAGQARTYSLSDSIVARYEKRVRAMVLASANAGGGE